MFTSFWFHVPSTHFDTSAYAHIIPLVFPTSGAKRPQPIFCGFAVFQVLTQGMKFPLYTPSNMAFLKLGPSKFDQFWVHTSIPMSPWIWEKDVITHHTSPLIFRIENYYHYQLFEVFMQHLFLVVNYVFNKSACGSNEYMAEVYMSICWQELVTRMPNTKQSNVPMSSPWIVWIVNTSKRDYPGFFMGRCSKPIPQWGPIQPNIGNIDIAEHRCCHRNLPGKIMFLVDSPRPAVHPKAVENYGKL